MKHYRILLYYKYVHIDNPEGFASEHLSFCKNLDVLGRILIAGEGINGTLSGSIEQTDEYIRYMRRDPRFTDIVYKIDEADEHAFDKLFVRHKKELVTFRLQEPLDPNEISGKRLTPKEFFEAMQNDNALIIDARTDYEYDVGHFRGAIRPEIDSFKDFPEWVRNNLSGYKNRPILTYCTGGIRCETFSGFLLREGFADVSQLQGGIVTYGKDPEIQGRLFDGRCYVFDKRISVQVNQTEENVVVGRCHHCGVPTERFVNCANMLCHFQHHCCDTCEIRTKRSCSPKCELSPHRERITTADV